MGGGQADGWADGLPGFLWADNHSRPLSAILGYTLFPPCVCAAGKGRGEVGWARICAGGSKTMRQGHVGAMKGKAGTYEYVAASRREEVLSGGGRPRGK